MPVPFHDVDDLEGLGDAAFLKLLPWDDGIPASDNAPAVGSRWSTSSSDTGELGPRGLAGALFVVNARGEPSEFAYNRLELPRTFLWRQADLRRHAERKLTASLLAICGRTPRLMLCLAEEASSELFGQDIRVSIPVGRIGNPLQASTYSAAETEETLAEPEPLQIFWSPAPPPEGSTERRLFDRLRAHNLLLEPFERAAVGLREVYGTAPG